MKMSSLISQLRFDRSGYEKALFIFLLIVSLIPIWSTKYFLTWDGPCHLYNAKILSDYISSKDVGYYDEYYRINRNLFPNWFSHIVLALLLKILPPFLAEKFFLSGYVVLYPLVFYYLIKAINDKNTFISFLVFPFIYSNAFQKGFYNFSFSIIFLFAAILFWLKNKDRFTYAKLTVFSILFLIIYFTHPLGYFYSLIVLFCLLITSAAVIRLNEKKRITVIVSTYRKKILILFIALLPSLLLLFQYLWRQKLAVRAGRQTLANYIADLLRLNSLVALASQEEIWTTLLSILIGLLILYSVFCKIKRRIINEYDGFFLAFLIALFLYFNTPEQVAGGFYLKIRLQIFPFILLLLWAAASIYRRWFKWFISICAVVVTLGLMRSRFPSYLKAAEALGDYLSVEEFIQDCSTVLPLSFSRRGKTPEGETVADRNQLFRHGLDYLGCRKTLILFDNFEGHMVYFPILWKRYRDPFTKISTNEGITNEPPSADILNYRSKTGGSIDYIVTWCLDKRYINHPYTESILKQLKQGYDLIYSSPTGRTILYRRKQFPRK